jgi:hypothetical protein
MGALSMSAQGLMFRATHFTEYQGLKGSEYFPELTNLPRGSNRIINDMLSWRQPEDDVFFLFFMHQAE